MQKKIMILGASALQVPAIKKAKELGYQVILVDYDANAVGFSLADIKLVVSTLDQEEVYRQALIYQPDVVITSTSDGPVRTAAYVNEKLGKQPDLSYKDSLCATIKSCMRDRLRENHLPIPEYYAVSNFDGFLSAVKNLKGCCIIKPADNAGSRGVVLINGSALPSNDQLLKTYEYSKENSRGGIVMVEEYMTGPEVSVEAMTINGETTIVTITDKFITPPPYFVEIAHSEPSMLDEKTKDKICQITKKALKAIGLINAPSHTEIKVTTEGPKIVELAARLGGDFITSKLVPLSTGVDMVGNSVLLATGNTVDLTKTRQNGSAIHFIQGEEGILNNISVDEAVYSLEGIEEVILYKKTGDAVHSTRSSNDRLGHIITTGKTPDEALACGKKALSYVHISYE